MSDDLVQTQFRLPRNLHEELRVAAEERGVGVNWLATRLLAESMDRLIPVEELRLTRSAAAVAREDRA